MDQKCDLSAVLLLLFFPPIKNQEITHDTCSICCIFVLFFALPDTKNFCICINKFATKVENFVQETKKSWWRCDWENKNVVNKNDNQLIFLLRREKKLMFNFPRFCINFWMSMQKYFDRNVRQMSRREKCHLFNWFIQWIRLEFTIAEQIKEFRRNANWWQRMHRNASYFHCINSQTSFTYQSQWNLQFQTTVRHKGSDNVVNQVIDSKVWYV